MPASGPGWRRPSQPWPSVVSELDPARLTGADATGLYALPGRPRAADQRPARPCSPPGSRPRGSGGSSGHRERRRSMLAALEGVSAGQAQSHLGHRAAPRPAARHRGRPATGTLSGPKVTELTGAGVLDPDRETELLDGAAEASPSRRCRERCHRSRATSGSDDPLATGQADPGGRGTSRRGPTPTGPSATRAGTPPTGGPRSSPTSARWPPACAGPARPAGTRTTESRAGGPGRCLLRPGHQAAPRPRAPDAGHPTRRSRSRPGPRQDPAGSDWPADPTSADPIARIRPGSAPARPRARSRDRRAPGRSGCRPRARAPGQRDRPRPRSGTTIPPRTRRRPTADDPVGEPTPTPPSSTGPRPARWWSGWTSTPCSGARPTSGECCEIDSQGPIPVPMARDLANDSFLRLVFHRAGDIRAVSHLGRTINRPCAPPWSTGTPPVWCPGCGVSFGLEIDHIVPFAEGGPTKLDNLALLCHHHHFLKTYEGWTLTRAAPKATAPPSGPSTPQPPFGQEPDLGIDTLEARRRPARSAGVSRCLDRSDSFIACGFWCSAQASVDSNCRPGCQKSSVPRSSRPDRPGRGIHLSDSRSSMSCSGGHRPPAVFHPYRDIDKPGLRFVQTTIRSIDPERRSRRDRRRRLRCRHTCRGTRGRLRPIGDAGSGGGGARVLHGAGAFGLRDVLSGFEGGRRDRRA